MRGYLYLGHLLGIPGGVSFPIPTGRANSRGGVRQDYVYVISRPDGHVKVGVTCNPPERIHNLQTGSSLPLEYRCCLPVAGDAYAVEDRAHELLEQYRLRGDWFEVAPHAARLAVVSAAGQLGVSLGERPVRQRGNLPVLAILTLALLACVGAMYYAWQFVDTANLGTVYNP